MPQRPGSRASPPHPHPQRTRPQPAKAGAPPAASQQPNTVLHAVLLLQRMSKEDEFRLRDEIQAITVAAKADTGAIVATLQSGRETMDT